MPFPLICAGNDCLRDLLLFLRRPGSRTHFTYPFFRRALSRRPSFSVKYAYATLSVLCLFLSFCCYSVWDNSHFVNSHFYTISFKNTGGAGWVPFRSTRICGPMFS